MNQSFAQFLFLCVFFIMLSLFSGYQSGKSQMIEKKVDHVIILLEKNK